MTPHAERFARVVGGADEGINLAEAALLIAAEEYRNLDIDSYLGKLDDTAATLKRRLRPDAGEVLVLLSDPSRAAEKLGWSAAVGLEEGLRRTAEWLQQNQRLYKPDFPYV